MTEVTLCAVYIDYNDNETMSAIDTTLELELGDPPSPLCSQWVWDKWIIEAVRPYVWYYVSDLRQVTHVDIWLYEEDVFDEYLRVEIDQLKPDPPKPTDKLTLTMTREEIEALRDWIQGGVLMIAGGHTPLLDKLEKALRND